MSTPPPPHDELGALDRIGAELLALQREIAELEYVRRADALEAVRDAVRRLGEVGSSSRIVERAAHELGSSAGFDRVLISEVSGRRLVPRAVWIAAGGDPAAALDELGRVPIPLEYPSIEAEILGRHQVEIVAAGTAGSRGAARLAEVFGWRSYIVCALVVRGTTVGLIHADVTASARALDAVDAEAAARFADGLAGVLERAILRDTLRSHREELQSAVQWMSARLGGLADAAAPGVVPQAARRTALLETLTARELDVLTLMARGRTNAAIAGSLMVREGTVKYHVKNILRKLGAANRADAVSRYLRAAAEDGGD